MRTKYMVTVNNTQLKLHFNAYRKRSGNFPYRKDSYRSLKKE